MLKFAHYSIYSTLFFVVQSCQNIQTQQCKSSYQYQVSSIKWLPVIDTSSTTQECIQLSSRLKSYEILSINFKLNPDDISSLDTLELASFSRNYAQEIYKLNLHNVSLEAIVIGYKKDPHDIEPIYHFDYAVSELMINE